MKKIISILTTFTLALILVACSNTTSKNVSDTIYIDIVQNTADKVYGIRYEYYIDDTPIGGGDIQNADYTAVSKSDILTAKFTDESFPEDTDLSQFAIEFYIMNKDGSENFVENRLFIAVSYGNRYSVEITGDKTAGYKSINE